MNDMTDILIKFNNAISYLYSSTSIFKRRKLKKTIHKFRKDLYNAVEKDAYTAPDIVNFCTLVSTASVLKYCQAQIDNVSIRLVKDDKGGRWPLVGIVYVNVDGNTFTYKAHMDSDIDMCGKIDMSWEISTESKFEPGKSFAQTHSTELDSLFFSDDDNSNRNKIDLLINSSYEILKNIFPIYIESIVDGAKRRFLK